MTRSPTVVLGVALSFGITIGFALAGGCTATHKPNLGTGGYAGAGETTTATSGGAASGTGTTGGAGGTGGMGGEGDTLVMDGGGTDTSSGVSSNPCGTECGTTELCDTDHLGLDDNCDGQVDEGCPCSTGQAHSCFKGDPAYAGSPGCFPGTEKCSEMGEYGPCMGGVHATADQQCYLNPLTTCHPITAVPFQGIHLKDGTGDFSKNADPATEVWSVTCPQGVSPCPGVGGVNPADAYEALQSGEYTVKYKRTLVGGGADSCTYPLFVGAPGLRVELEWEHDKGGSGVDLDLHLHQPKSTLPWSISGQPQDCGWSSCTIDQFQFGFASPSWFGDGAPPDPVNWYLDPVFEKNTCYFAPRGKGATWQLLGLGCHNPRLDLDNIHCNPGVVDPTSNDFCAPENINVDFPPKNQWMRIGVHYYGNNGMHYSVHPSVKVYCNGALSAQLGPAGYYSPEKPITFVAADGDGDPGLRFWLVADVAFTDGKCGTKSCVVEPLYSSKATRSPVLVSKLAAELTFGPDSPPPLQ